MVLTTRALNRALLARQMLLSKEAITPLHAIERLIGLQAQQPRPPFTGLWSRLENFQSAALLGLIQNRQVVRATMMRGTLHLVTAKDYVAFRHTLQPSLTAGMQSILSDRGAGLDPQAVAALAAQSFHERPQTFTDLRAALLKYFPEANERALGYMARICLPLVIVPEESDCGYGADPRFANAEPWLNQTLDPEDRLQELVLRYLSAFGPSTVADAQTWSAIPKLKPVFEALRPKLRVFAVSKSRELFDVENGSLPPEDTPAPIRFLPAFDNIVLAHTDRSRIVADEHRPRVVSKNLQVAPTFLIDGFVAGTWTLSTRKNAATLTISPFAPLTRETKKEVETEAAQLLPFLAPDAAHHEVTFTEA